MQVEEEGKSTKTIKKGKQILTYANIVHIYDEDDTIPLTHFYSQIVIKEEPSDAKTNTNQVGAFEEQTKGFQRSKVGARGKGVEIQMRKLVF